MYANSTRCIVQVDLREARVEGSSAERRGESESKVERSRPLMISMSGRRRRRTSGVTWGKSQAGRRVPLTPWGRVAEGQASMIVYQEEGEKRESVDCIRRTARLWRWI